MTAPKDPAAMCCSGIDGKHDTGCRALAEELKAAILRTMQRAPAPAPAPVHTPPGANDGCPTCLRATLAESEKRADAMGSMLDRIASTVDDYFSRVVVLEAVLRDIRGGKCSRCLGDDDKPEHRGCVLETIDALLDAGCVWCGYPEPRVPTYSGSSVHETVNTPQTVNDAQEEER